MLEFCGLPWDSGFERGFRRHSFERSRADAFRRDLPDAEVERLTRLLAAGSTLTATLPRADRVRQH